MIRLTLRQFRTEGTIGFGLLAALAIVLTVTGLHLAQVNDSFLAACKAAHNCASSVNPVVGIDKRLQAALPSLVTVAPALIGIFFGAPILAREFEHGTFRLAWTQSLTRPRWLAARLGLVGLAAMAIGGVLAWMVDWWAAPIDAINQDRFTPAAFGVHGVVPIGYSAFAFMLGACAGVFFRRTVPSIAATLAGFVAARVGVTYGLRSRFVPPLHESLSLAGNGGGFSLSEPGNALSIVPPDVNVPNGWVYSTAVVDKSGDPPTSAFLVHTCPNLLAQLPHASNAAQGVANRSGGRRHAVPAMGPNDMAACMQTLGRTFHVAVTYQPGSRFWPFQWAELGVFVAASLALGALTYWWLQRQFAPARWS